MYMCIYIYIYIYIYTYTYAVGRAVGHPPRNTILTCGLYNHFNNLCFKHRLSINDFSYSHFKWFSLFASRELLKRRLLK